MTIIEKRKQDLFGDEDDAPKQKTKRPTGPLTLDNLQAVTVFYDIFSDLKRLENEKGIEYLVFKRDRGGRFAPSKKCFFTVVAIKAGTPKARRVKWQKNVLASVDVGRKVNQRRNSNQYRLLKQFYDELK